VTFPTCDRDALPTELSAQAVGLFYGIALPMSRRAVSDPDASGGLI